MAKKSLTKMQKRRRKKLMMRPKNVKNVKKRLKKTGRNAKNRKRFLAKMLMLTSLNKIFLYRNRQIIISPMFRRISSE